MNNDDKPKGIPTHEDDLNTVPSPKTFEPNSAPEVVFARMVGEMLDDKLSPLQTDIHLVSESVKLMRDEIRDRLRSHELEIRELRKDLKDLDRRVLELEKGE